MKNLAILLFFSILLTSCSYKFLVIPNLDFIITNKTASNLNINSSEKRKLKKDVQNLLEKSKPIISKAKIRIQNINIKNTNIKKEFELFRRDYFQIAQKLNPILADKISSFDEYQYKGFFKKLKDTNERIKTKAHEKKLDDYLERYEYFFGSLNKTQIKIIKETLPTFKAMTLARIKRRIKVYKGLQTIALLRDQNKKKTAINKLFDEASNGLPLSGESIKLTKNIKKLIDTLSSKQVEKFNERKEFILSWVIGYLEENYR